MSLWMNYIRSGYAKSKRKKHSIGRNASLYNVSVISFFLQFLFIVKFKHVLHIFYLITLFVQWAINFIEQIIVLQERTA